MSQKEEATMGITIVVEMSCLDQARATLTRAVYTCSEQIMLGRDFILSALHWGPLPEVDAFWKTSGQHQIRRADYCSAYIPHMRGGVERRLSVCLS